MSENDAIYFTLTSPTDVATRSALVLATKDSFLSLVTNLNNKNKVCKQSISLFAGACYNKHHNLKLEQANGYEDGNVINNVFLKFSKRLEIV